MIRINLLPVKVSRRQEAVRNELILAGGIAGVLLLFLVAAQVAVSARANTYRAENAALNQEIQRAEEILKELEQQEKMQTELEKKLALIKQLKANKAGPVHMLDQLAIATPEKLSLESLDEKKGKVELTGTAVSNEVISQFLSNLEQSEYFEDVFLNSIDQVDKQGVKLKTFSITARLIVPGSTETQTPAAPEKGGKAG